MYLRTYVHAYGYVPMYTYIRIGKKDKVHVRQKLTSDFYNPLLVCIYTYIHEF